MIKYKSNLIFIAIIFSSIAAGAQSYNSFYGSIVNLCSFDSINNNLIEFENLGIKEHGTLAQKNTLNWLINKYADYGYLDIEIDTFNYAAQDSYNLVVTKHGTIYPNSYLIVDAHYDTKNGPGTNDNGSGVSIILEIARLLQNVDTEFSIKFINFSGEEDGLVGSSSYVNNIVVPNNMDIKLVFNIDQVGGINSTTNNKIICERDESSPTLSNASSWLYTDTLATCVSLYSNLITEISFAYSSDYIPFQYNNEVITGLFEKNQSPYTHTPSDILSNMDVNYVYEVAKAAIGASLFFAVAFQTNVGIATKNKTVISIYPNPVKDILTINLNKLAIDHAKLCLIDAIGKTILLKKINTQKEQLLMNNFPSGIYTLVISSPTFYIAKKIVHSVY